MVLGNLLTFATSLHVVILMVIMLMDDWYILFHWQVPLFGVANLIACCYPGLTFEFFYHLIYILQSRLLIVCILARYFHMFWFTNLFILKAFLYLAFIIFCANSFLFHFSGLLLLSIWKNFSFKQIQFHFKSNTLKVLVFQMFHAYLMYWWLLLISLFAQGVIYLTLTNLLETHIF